MRTQTPAPARTPPALPTLEAGPWRLRPWRVDDAAALAAAVRESLERFAPWLAWAHRDYDTLDAVAFIAGSLEGWQRGERYAFAVVDSRDGGLVASADLSQLDERQRSANLGYWVRSGCQGRGICPRIVPAVARFGFEALGLVRVEIVADLRNRASRRVAEKAGARFEGIARQRLMDGDRRRDAAVYALIPADLG